MRRVPGPAARADDLDGPLTEVPVRPAPGAGAPRSSRWRFRAGVAAAGAVYFALACLLFWPVPPWSSTHLAGCACGDPEQQAWFLAWLPYALGHGLNPFFTSYINVPHGANLAIDTAMPLLGVLGTPVTLLAGPVVTANVLLRLGLAASGASMFGVLRRYVAWWPAAFGGGLLFGFSPYVTDQAVRHIFLSFVPLVPLLVPLLDDWLVSRSRSPVRSGLLIGLVAALQYLISPEILLTSAIMAIVGLAALALRYRSVVTEKAGALLPGLAAAVPVFLLIAGYPVWLLIAGPNRPQGAFHRLHGLSRYHADLLSPLIPAGHQLFAPGGLAAFGNRLPPGGTVENGFYLGLPLLVLLGYLGIRYRRVPLVMVSAVVALTAFVLGLGSRLTIAGKRAGIPLPFAVFQHLPILQNLEAARLSLFIQLAAAIIFAIGLDRAVARGWGGATAGDGQPGPADDPAPRPGAPRWVRPGTVVAVGLAAIVPLAPHIPLRTALVRTPEFFSSAQVHPVAPGALALTFPFEVAPRNDAMMWQAAAGMRFRLLGGDVFVPRTNGRSTWHPLPPGPPVLSEVLLAGQYRFSPPPPMTAAAAAAIRTLCARSAVSVVFVDRSWRYGKDMARLVRAALRVPPLVRGRLDVWLNVRRDLRQP